MPVGVKLVTGPAPELLSREAAKTYLRALGDDDDADVDALKAEARAAAEAECGRAFLTSTWELTLDDFPRCEGGVVRLPRPPLQSVTWVKYYDADGVQQTVDAADYWVAAAAEPGRVVPKPGYWPAVESGRPEAVTVRFVAGWTSAAQVPLVAVAAVKEILADRWEHRGDEDRPAGVPAVARRLLAALETGELR